MKKFFIIFTFLFIFYSYLYPQSTDVNELLILDKKFYSTLAKKSRIERDSYLKKYINRVVQTRATIKSIDASQRYKKRFRIILSDKTAAQYKLQIMYYIYLDDQSTIEMLHKDEKFEFSGQFMTVTPTNTRRDSYIFDIILEKGALIVD